MCLCTFVSYVCIMQICVLLGYCVRFLCYVGFLYVSVLWRVSYKLVCYGSFVCLCAIGVLCMFVGYRFFYAVVEDYGRDVSYDKGDI